MSTNPTGEDRRARVVMNMHGFVRKMEMYLEMNFIFPTEYIKYRYTRFEYTYIFSQL